VSNVDICQPASQSTGRVLGIDTGERRVGLALSDELGLLASPLAIIRRDGGLATVMEQIAGITVREGVARVVVGLPLNEDGTIGRQARRAEVFANVARKALGVPVELWNEHLSTAEAETRVRELGRSARRPRERSMVDAYAAAVILQDYLDAQRRNRAEPRGE
jgi:putative Holliday junction resolvase